MELPPTLPNKLVDDKKYIGPVIEEYIWYPEVPRVDDDAVHSAVVRNVPAELIVAPSQVEPHAGGQQLVLLVQVNDLLQRHAECYDDGGGLVHDGSVLCVVVLEKIRQQFLLIRSTTTS